MKISIIVPIYNAENTLRHCLMKLIGQTYRDLEIILVDDGSTDCSAEICKEISSDSRVIYIYQDNAGVSVARNTGIEIASGDYIAFCDSDDWYETDAFETLIDLSKNGADLIIGGIHKYFPNYQEYVCCNCYVCSSRQECSILIRELEKTYMINQMWGKLFKAEIVKKNKIMFDPLLNNGEDLDFICRFLKYVDSMVSVDKVVYNYIIQSSGTLSTTFNVRWIEMFEKSMNSLKQALNIFLTENETDEIMAERYLQRYWVTFVMIAKNKKLSKKNKIKLIQCIVNKDTYKYYIDGYKNKLSLVKRLILNFDNAKIILGILTLVGKFHG